MELSYNAPTRHVAKQNLQWQENSFLALGQRGLVDTPPKPHRPRLFATLHLRKKPKALLLRTLTMSS